MANAIPTGAIPMGHNFGRTFIPFGRFATYVTRQLTTEVDYLAAWYWLNGGLSDEQTRDRHHRQALYGSF